MFDARTGCVKCGGGWHTSGFVLGVVWGVACLLISFAHGMALDVVQTKSPVQEDFFFLPEVGFVLHVTFSSWSRRLVTYWKNVWSVDAGCTILMRQLIFFSN